MSPLKAIGAFVVTVAVIGAVIVGGYLGGWWLQKDINNRQAHLNRTTFEQQTTYRDEMVRKIQDVRSMDVQLTQVPVSDTDELAKLKAQRISIVNIVCRDNTHISGGLDTDTAAFVSQECA